MLCTKIVPPKDGFGHPTRKTAMNDIPFEYDSGNSPFLFQIYKALFEKPKGVTVTFDKKTFCKKHVVTPSNSSSNGQFIWAYLDVGRCRYATPNDGIIYVDFDSIAHEARPALPVAKDEIPISRYAIFLRYGSQSNAEKDHNYAIMFNVREDKLIPWKFKSPYIKSLGVRKVLVEPDWNAVNKKSDSKVSAGKEDDKEIETSSSDQPIQKQARAFSWDEEKEAVKQKATKKRVERPGEEKEVVADTPIVSEAFLKKARPHFHNGDPNRFYGDYTPDQKAFLYAKNILLSNEKSRNEIVTEAAKMFEGAVKAKLEVVMEKRVYEEAKAAHIAKMKSDPRLEASFRKEAIRELFNNPTEKAAIRREALNKLLEEEKKVRAAHLEAKRLSDLKDLEELKNGPKILDPQKPDNPIDPNAVSEVVESFDWTRYIGGI